MAFQIFNYEGRSIRTVESNGEMWWALKDVCEILGIVKYRDTASRLDDDERGLAKLDTLGGGAQQSIIINESGLYNVIMRSDKPEAKKFKRWVTHEVLPSIRKEGAYITPRADPAALRRKADELESMATLNDTAKILLPIFEQAGMKPAFQALAMKQIYRKAGIDLPMLDLKADRELYDLKTIARKVGLYSLAGKPHERAIGAIIRQLHVPDEEKELVNFEKQGHMGTTYQYTAAVVDMVQEWLIDHDCPVLILGKKSGKEIAYKVQYQAKVRG